jgi:phosphoglycolate phosphatase
MHSDRGPARFDLLVFDWDGTLYDSTALIAQSIQAACADLGEPTPSAEQARWVIGMGLQEALRSAVPGLAVQRYPELAQRYRHHYVARQHDVTLFEGVEALLRGLQARGHTLAVATGKSRRGLDEALAQSGLKSVFAATRTADETFSKPHPRMLLELMDELGVGPGRTLMVGDTTHDLQLALNAGVSSVAVSYGAHESQHFPSLQPAHVAHSVAELHHWLMTHA